MLSKKALALSPAGIEYEAERMTFMLEEREIKPNSAETAEGQRSKKRAAEDDIRFLSTLEKIVLREIQRKIFNFLVYIGVDAWISFLPVKLFFSR